MKDGRYGTVSLCSFSKSNLSDVLRVASPEFCSDQLVGKYERCRINGDTYYPNAKIIRDNDMYSCFCNQTELKSNLIQYITYICKQDGRLGFPYAFPRSHSLSLASSGNVVRVSVDGEELCVHIGPFWNPHQYGLCSLNPWIVGFICVNRTSLFSPETVVSWKTPPKEHMSVYPWPVWQSCVFVWQLSSTSSSDLWLMRLFIVPWLCSAATWRNGPWMKPTSIRGEFLKMFESPTGFGEILV